VSTDGGRPTSESPDEASGYATGDAPFSLETQPGDGFQFSSITVPEGVSGEVSMREVRELAGAPQVTGVTWVGQRLDLVAPSAPADNPLTIAIHVEKVDRKQRVDGRNVVLYHSEESEGPPMEIPRCERGPKGRARPGRCLSSARSIRRDGVSYVRLLVYATDNGSWRPGFK